MLPRPFILLDITSERCVSKFAGYSKDRKESYSSDVKYFLNNAFVREISPKLSDSFGIYRHEYVNLCMLERSFRNCRLDF